MQMILSTMQQQEGVEGKNPGMFLQDLVMMEE